MSIHIRGEGVAGLIVFLALAALCGLCAWDAHIDREKGYSRYSAAVAVVCEIFGILCFLGM